MSRHYVFNVFKFLFERHFTHRCYWTWQCQCQNLSPTENLRSNTVHTKCSKKLFFDNSRCWVAVAVSTHIVASTQSDTLQQNTWTLPADMWRRAVCRSCGTEVTQRRNELLRATQARYNIYYGDSVRLSGRSSVCLSVCVVCLSLCVSCSWSASPWLNVSINFSRRSSFLTSNLVVLFRRRHIQMGHEKFTIFNRNGTRLLYNKRSCVVYTHCRWHSVTLKSDM